MRACVFIVTTKTLERVRCLSGAVKQDFADDSQSFQKNCPAGIYLFKDNNGNTRTIREICSNLTMKTPERCL